MAKENMVGKSCSVGCNPINRKVLHIGEILFIH